MTTEKTLGQIAYEAMPNVFDVPHRWPWDHAMVADRMHWERIANSVAAAQQKRVAAWLLSQPDMCTTDSQAALAEAAQMLMHGDPV